MKRKIVGLFAVMAMLVGCLPAMASSEIGIKYGDYLYYQINEDNATVTITDCDQTATKLEIPGEIEGLRVVSIGNGTFRDCKRLTTVKISNSVTSIGDYAFSGCSYLKNIDIPNSVNKLGEYAFDFCSRLTTVTIGDGVDAIGDSAFSHCACLENVKMGNGVKSIGGRAFVDCFNLTVMTLPKGVERLGHSFIANCKNLSILNIPNSIKVINGGIVSAFNGSSVTDIYYAGTKTQWEAVEMDQSTKSDLENVTIHYNSTYTGNIEAVTLEPCFRVVYEDHMGINHSGIESTSGFAHPVTIIWAYYKDDVFQSAITKDVVVAPKGRVLYYNDEEDKSLTEKIFIWDSLSGMKPLTK